MKEYNIFVNDTRAFYRLVGLCFLIFIGLAILWFVMVAAELPDTVIKVSGAVGLAIPFVVYFWFKRKTSLPARVLLHESYIEIYLSGNMQKIMFDEVKSFSAYRFESNDDDDKASLRIRLKSGRKVRLYATSNICNIEPLAVLCEDFKRLATQHNIVSKFWSW